MSRGSLDGAGGCEDLGVDACVCVAELFDVRLKLSQHC